VAEQLPNNRTTEDAVAKSPHVPQPGEADSHLEHLLAPRSIETPLLVGLYRSIKELINPPKLPPLEITSKPIEVKTMKGLYSGNEWKAGLVSAAINGGIIALLLIIGTNKQVQEAIKEQIVLIAPNLRKPPPIEPKQQSAQGGGGSKSKFEESKGKLPKVAPKQFAPPKTPIDNPKLPVTPTIVADANLPNIDASNFGDPLAGLGIPSTGGGGLGTGIGSGKGPGYGPGSGGGFGGGAYRPGGGVSLPVPITKPEPEYSEEARKAKYQGSVTLQIVVDEKGVPTDIRVVKKLGLGLDEKAIEAVAKWRFKPGMKDGKPVAVIATIEVSFRLL
jgi:protein TonB